MGTSSAYARVTSPRSKDDPLRPGGTMPGVAAPTDDDLALATLAARNNAEWCDIFCRSRGVPGIFHADAWASPIRTPARYPDGIALDRSLTGERILSYVDS